MPPRTAVPWADDPSTVRPMLASTAPAGAPPTLESPRLVYEPKYDGMRVLVHVEPGHPSADVRLWSRLGHDKTTQFPDLVRDLKRFARSLRRGALLDGEIVALDEDGEPVGFQRLQRRIHLTGATDVERAASTQPVALVLFDVLRDGVDDLRRLPLSDRRARLETIVGNAGSEQVRLAEQSAGDGRRLHDRAVTLGLEGLIAKDSASTYESGRRSRAWVKLKLPRRQEFVVGGWTEPRGTRRHFGSLLLGYYEGAGRARRLVYAGPVGSGFTERDLDRFAERLSERETARSPFTSAPNPPERPHWTTPDLVVEVKFTEWTDEGVLRHPVFVGERDDIDPRSVRREAAAGGEDAGRPAHPSGRAPAASASAPQRSPRLAPRGPVAAPDGSIVAARVTDRAAMGISPGDRPPAVDPVLGLVIEQLDTLERARRNGPVVLPDGSRLDVTNLAKVFWPERALTKGDLLRYYARVSPLLLPNVADRPLVMKRLPNGVAGKSFYQQRAPDDVPPGVRVEVAAAEAEGETPRLVGGTLLTLLYMTQLATISQDPWFSRVDEPGVAREAALDLDPMPGVTFEQVVDVARWIHDELETLGVPAVAKTSGASGLHVYLPLAPATPYQAGQLFCQLVATLVATKHPKQATVERAVGRRGRTVYIDYLQNIEGKTLATAYSARGNAFAGVSTPLSWDEVTRGLRPEDFTIETAPARFAERGDLWAPLHGRHRLDLRAALDRAQGKLL